MSPKTYVFGDIHGALRALVQVIAAVHPEETDTLIFLGDYVDGWPESAGVIDYLIDLDTRHNCLFLKGNHDMWAEEWLRGGVPDNTWLAHGGASTLTSYETLDIGQRSRHLTFLSALTPYFIDPMNRLFVHAGFTAMRGPLYERTAAAFSWDRTLWETALAGDSRLIEDSVKYPRRFLLFKEIYIGHTPTTNVNSTIPMHAFNVWNIDTGAAFGGKLTALDAGTKQYWQSDVVRQLYPGEKGRSQ